MPLNKFLGIEYTRYGDAASTHDRELTDKVIVKGLVTYLKRYYTWDGKWNGISINGKFPPKHDFFITAQIKPTRFYEIFKNYDRTDSFMSYFKEFNVQATLEHGSLSLVDLEHPKNINN
ncbi:hypothetical protein AB7942_24000 [Neobacillus sp. BF23-41]|uniref:hypothetical protein n=1 Tax=Neobacillus sp. BF23-41 TaxID=3240280 RepID=UPI0034E5EC22